MRSEPDQVSTFDCEKARIILHFPTLRSVWFYAIKTHEKSCDRFAMSYIEYADGHFHFLCFLSWAPCLFITHLCLARVPLSMLSWEIELKLIFTFVLMKEAGRKRNRRRRRNSWALLHSDRKEEAQTYNTEYWKINDPFLFEVHCLKDQDEHILWWWQPLSHNCTNLSYSKSLQT